jgi:oligopeptidase B
MLDLSVRPPTAPVIDHVTRIHDDVRIDPYHWMRDKNDPRVIDHLKAENAYTEAVTRPLQSLTEKLYDEFLSRIKQTDLSVPYRLGTHWYYTRTEEGLQYPVYCRKKGDLDGPEQILLDLNAMAQDRPYLSLGLFSVSDDENLLAYSIDTTGFREYELFIKDLRTGKDLPEPFGRVNTAAWASDSRTLFFTREDTAKRPFQLFRRELGGTDELLYTESDERYRIGVYRTGDRQFIVMASASSETTENHVIPSTEPRTPMRLLLPREEGHEYYIDHHGRSFYIRTNKNANNFKLVTVDDTAKNFNAWTERIPHRESVKLDAIELFREHLVVTENEAGLTSLRFLHLTTGAMRAVHFPEPVYSVFSDHNPEFDTATYRFKYQSYTTPESVFEIDMTTGVQRLLKETEVLGNYDRTQYESLRLFASALDGQNIPISLVMKKGTPLDGSAPLLLYGYGSYGIGMTASFSVRRLSLLERGVVFAIAHIRGGDEMGERWHDDGKMMNKLNTFTDFIACAELLHRSGYSSPNRTAIQGGSAGGLLIGAVINKRPDLCCAAHLAVPFVDVVNTMLDDSLPLTIGEYLEWGDPKIKAEYDYIKSYCPYTNVRRQNYPSVLVTTSLNDSQVMYWEPAKYVAKLRTHKTGTNPVLFKINLDAGHSGASGRYDALKEQAFQYAFLLERLGIEN